METENNIEFDETSLEKINDVLNNEPANKLAEEITKFINEKIKEISKQEIILLPSKDFFNLVSETDNLTAKERSYLLEKRKRLRERQQSIMR
jgi:hypothetical protein